MARPRGIWSDKPWREAIRKAVAKRDKDGGKALELMAERVVRSALESEAGWMEAVQEVANRLDGKAHQSTDVTISDERMVVNASTPAETAEEWEQKHRPH